MPTNKLSILQVNKHGKLFFSDTIKAYSNCTNKDIYITENRQPKVGEWFQIIDKAKNELINNVQIAKIESAIKSLSKHLDAKTKLEMELKEIMQDAQKPLA